MLTPKSSALVLAISIACLASGCAVFEKRKDSDDAQRPGSAELRAQLVQLTAKVEELQGRMGSMSDKVDATQASFEVFMSRQGKAPVPRADAKRTHGVAAHPSEGLGKSTAASVSASDPEGGFVNDEAVLLFRKASVLYQARKYPEAVLSFASFVEKYPDHPLAGSAQFYVGSSYFKQKENKLALQEYERLLTSYDRSPKVADALRDMATIEDQLQMKDEAARHRQLLSSVYPQSPAAGRAETASAIEPDEKPQPRAPRGGAKLDEVPVPTAPLSEEKPQ